MSRTAGSDIRAADFVWPGDRIGNAVRLPITSDRSARRPTFDSATAEEREEEQAKHQIEAEIQRAKDIIRSYEVALAYISEPADRQVLKDAIEGLSHAIDTAQQELKNGNYRLASLHGIGGINRGSVTGALQSLNAASTIATAALSDGLGNAYRETFLRFSDASENWGSYYSKWGGGPGGGTDYDRAWSSGNISRWTGDYIAATNYGARMADAGFKQWADPGYVKQQYQEALGPERIRQIINNQDQREIRGQHNRAVITGDNARHGWNKGPNGFDPGNHMASIAKLEAARQLANANGDVLRSSILGSTKHGMGADMALRSMDAGMAKNATPQQLEPTVMAGLDEHGNQIDTAKEALEAQRKLVEKKLAEVEKLRAEGKEQEAKGRLAELQKFIQETNPALAEMMQQTERINKDFNDPKRDPFMTPKAKEEREKRNKEVDELRELNKQLQQTNKQLEQVMQNSGATQEDIRDRTTESSKTNSWVDKLVETGDGVKAVAQLEAELRYAEIDKDRVSALSAQRGKPTIDQSSVTTIDSTHDDKTSVPAPSLNLSAVAALKPPTAVSNKSTKISGGLNMSAVAALAPPATLPKKTDKTKANSKQDESSQPNTTQTENTTKTAENTTDAKGKSESESGDNTPKKMQVAEASHKETKTPKTSPDKSDKPADKTVT